MGSEQSGGYRVEHAQGPAPVFPFGELWRGPLLAVAGSLSVLGALLPGGYPWWVAIGLAILWGLPAAMASSVWAVAPLLPLLALIDGSWLTLLLALFAAALLPLLAHWRQERRQDGALRQIRAELHDYRRETEILERHLDRYPALLETCLQLAVIRDIDAWARCILAAAVELVGGARQAQVALVDERGTTVLAESGPSQPGVIERQEVLDYVASEGRAWVQRSAASVVTLLPLGLPPTGPQRRQGLLHLEFTSRGLEDHLVLEAIDALGRIAAQGLAAIDLLEEARSLALHDDLTGLYGKHEFLRRLDEQIAVVRRQDDSLGLIMCDLDHLKAFNDRWGHAVGDEALKAIGAAIAAGLPEDAVACRYGGEEFAILVPFSRGGKVHRVAEELHRTIAGLRPWPEHPERHVTASLGWAVLGVDEGSAGLLQRADDALYRAKKAGRDRVQSAEVQA